MIAALCTVGAALGSLLALAGLLMAIDARTRRRPPSPPGGA